MVTKVYLDYVNRIIAQKGRENVHIITSPCPAIMNYVEKHHPELISEFAPIMSPIAAQAVLVKHWNGGDVAIVGANPCTAKKSELLDEGLGLYDEDLTFEELITLIDSKGIVPSGLEESGFDGIQAFYGAGFPISGGLVKTMELFTDQEIDPISNDLLILEGEGRSTEFLKRMARSKIQGRLAGYPLLVDILYCEGCILGKSLGVESDFMENKRIVSEYTRKRFKKIKDSPFHYRDYQIQAFQP